MQRVENLPATIWLLIYKQGGWWSAAEVESALAVPPGTIINELTRCVDSGFLKKREVPEDRRKRQYAVMPDCRVPRGITVGEVVL